MIKSVSFSDHARNSSINSSTKKISKNRLDLSSKNKLKFNDNSIDILDEEIVKLQKELVILKNRMLIN